MSTDKTRFLNDVRDHVMEVHRDDGLYRHIRFRKPGTMCMHFDLLTWPGYLCYTGDMGTYVFRRLEDMLQFFRPYRGSKHEPMDSIDFGYWAEKLEGSDKGDGHREFDSDRFEREITEQRRRLLVRYTKRWSTDDRQDLWDALQEVKDAANDGEHRAFQAVWDFSFQHRGERVELSTDDFPNCKRMTHRFEWCCYALRWAVLRYDEAKAAQLEHA